MKLRNGYCSALVLALAMWLIFGPARITRATNVLFHGANVDTTFGDDAAVFSHLQSLFGADNVQYIQADRAATDASSAIGFDAVVLSSTFVSTILRDVYEDTPVGVPSWEQALKRLYPGEFQLSTWGRTAATQTQIDIVLLIGPPISDAQSPKVGSRHWSFEPIASPPTPATSGDTWIRNDIDRFILAELESRGLPPSPEADRYTLLRRLSLDLTGLPPGPEEVAAFVSDERPDAYLRLVDRLLASPHFGERFAHHWLDLARYGDSDGFEPDAPRPNAYRWRDWVIDAVNADMPFDRFTIEQLAGDLLPDPTPQQVLATGFHRNAPTNREGGIDQEAARVQTIVERTNTTGTVWLGLTVGCAECHSHKFDPLSLREYYQLYAFFNDAVEEVDVPVPPSPEDLQQHEREKAAHAERVQSLRERVAEAEGEERERLERFLERLERRAPEDPQTFLAAFGPAEQARETHVHEGGDYRRKGEPVDPGTPQILPPLSPRGVHSSTGSKPIPRSSTGWKPIPRPDRLDLARWIVDPANPLTARVEANRIWQYLFGTGLVTTPDDFGTQGDPPSHPELLDHLAERLVSLGWSRKALIRYIVSSSTYRQASSHRSELAARDPNNRLLARQNRFRISAEIVRDLYLAAGGLLNRRVGGPSMRPEIPPGFEDFGFSFNWTVDEPAERHRRGMYIFYQRNMVFPLLRTFDRPDTNVTCVRRERSNTPLQALAQLNDPEFVQAAAALGRRILHEADADPEARIEFAYLVCYGRPPAARERAYIGRLWGDFHDHYRGHGNAAEELAAGEGGSSSSPPSELAAWIAVARVLMNTDEFITRE